MAIFEGGVTYQELRDMPMPELAVLHREAKRIVALRKKK
jgi:hypothetical protein